MEATDKDPDLAQVSSEERESQCAAIGAAGDMTTKLASTSEGEDTRVENEASDRGLD